VRSRLPWPLRRPRSPGRIDPRPKLGRSQGPWSGSDTRQALPSGPAFDLSQARPTTPAPPQKAFCEALDVPKGPETWFLRHGYRPEALEGLGFGIAADKPPRKLSPVPSSDVFSLKRLYGKLSPVTLGAPPETNAPPGGFFSPDTVLGLFQMSTGISLNAGHARPPGSLSGKRKYRRPALLPQSKKGLLDPHQHKRPAYLWRAAPRSWPGVWARALSAKPNRKR